MSPVIDALDRIAEIAACLEAVSDLMSPELDLHAVNRDKQAMLLAFLLTEHNLAYAKLSAAVKR